MKEQAKKILSHIKDYYLSSETTENLRKNLKYNGGGQINLDFKSKFKENKYSLSLTEKVLFYLNVNEKDLSFTLNKPWFKDESVKTFKLITNQMAFDFSVIEAFLFRGAVIAYRNVSFSER